MEFSHVTVLLREAVDGLDIRPDGVYIDGTAGGGGHSAEILSRLTSGSLYSIDQDPDAIATVTERFKGDSRSHIVQGNFGQMKRLLNDLGVTAVDGVLLDIGFSDDDLLSAVEEVRGKGAQYRKGALETWENMSDSEKICDEFFDREIGILNDVRIGDRENEFITQ